VTLVPVKVECKNTHPFTLSGNFIGTITSPACEVESKNTTLKFSASSATQEHKTYTGVNYNLTSQTGTGTIKEASQVSEITTSSETAGTFDCT